VDLLENLPHLHIGVSLREGILGAYKVAADALSDATA
jgi:hypothetical protein